MGNAVGPTQRHKGAETQGLRLLGKTTCWGSHLDLSFPRHLLVLCAFASWRLCVNRPFWTKHLAEGIAADYDATGRLAGLEVLDAVRRFGDKATMQRVVLEGFAESTSVLREKPGREYGA